MAKGKESHMDDLARLEKKWIAAAILGILFMIVAFAFLPYIKGVLGALLMFILLRPLHRWLESKGANRAIAAVGVITVSLAILLVPVSIGTTILIAEVNGLIQEKDHIVEYASSVIKSAPFDVEVAVGDVVEKGATFLRNALISFLGNATALIINAVIMYVILYYLLVHASRLQEWTYALIPFSYRNARRLARDVSRTSYSMVLSTGLIAVLQGTLLGLSFWMFGVPKPFLWGFVGMVFSFVPALGVPLIWIPAAIIMWSLGIIPSAIGIAVSGTIISTIDNVLRPILGKRIGDIHPLITILGVFIGVPLFGILGLFIGPLLLSIFLVVLSIYREEYGLLGE